MTDDAEQLQRDHIYAKHWHLLDDDVGTAITQCLAVGCAGDFERGILSERIANHKLAMEACPFATPQLHAGELLLGYAQNESEIRIPAAYFGSPTLIVGTTGSGKTNACKYWGIQLAPMFTGAWFIDCRKQEMRGIVPILEHIGIPVSIVTPNGSKINPLQVPDNLSPIDHAIHAAESIARSLKLPPGATKLCHQAIHVLYDTHGILDGNTENYPILAELRDFVANTHLPHVHPESRNSLITALDTVLISLNHVFAYRRGFQTADLARMRIIFELDACIDSGRELIIDTLLTSAFQSRLARGRSNTPPDLLIYLDESSYLLESEDSSIADRWIGLVRGLGLALMFSNQTATCLHPKILSNIPNRFVAQCSSFADLDIMASSMGLELSQKRYLATALTPGMLLATIGQGPWRHPFLCTPPLIPRLPLTNIHDSYTNALATLPVVAAEEYMDWKPDWAHQDAIPQPHNAPSRTTPPTKGHVPPDALRLLRVIVAHPCNPLSFYPSEAKMGKQTINRLRKLLVARKLITEESVQLSGGRGRPATLLAPTDKGIALATDKEHPNKS